MWGLISFALVFGIETVNYLIVKPRVDSTPELAEWTKNIIKAQCPFEESSAFASLSEV